ncbi:MAG: hypothetical protein ACOX9E_11820, partial [Lentisphaeria bacterium]
RHLRIKKALKAAGSRFYLDGRRTLKAAARLGLPSSQSLKIICVNLCNLRIKKAAPSADKKSAESGWKPLLP